MAREAMDIVTALGLEGLYVRSARDSLDNTQAGFQVICETNVLAENNISYVIGIGDPKIRYRLSRKFSGKVKFTNIIHPSATFGFAQREKITKKKGLIISAGVRFTNNISVGNFGIYNLNSTISHDCTLSDFITVSPGANILGNVSVGTGSWIGSGVTINQGSEIAKRIIGENVIIGSGSVVLSDCEDNHTYVGIPARRIK